MSTTFYLRRHAFTPYSPVPVVLGRDLLELQKLQLTLVSLMTAIGLNSEHIRTCTRRSDQNEVLEYLKPLRDLLGLAQTRSLEPELEASLEAIDALAVARDLSMFAPLFEQQPWDLMGWAKRGCNASPALGALVCRMLDSSEPRDFHLYDFSVKAKDVRILVNLIDSQRRTRKPDYTESIRFPDPGRHKCFDHFEAVLRTLADEDSPGFTLVTTEVLDI